MSSSALLYETEDAEFADACIDALKDAEIGAYKTGGSVAGGSTPLICIYVRDSSDLAKANSILIKLGAAVEQPLKLPSRIVLAALALAAAVLIVAAATHFK
jgi:hypothetical protein